MEEYQQILKDQFGKILPALRNFVSKGNWSDAVLKITKQFNLPEDKYIVIENEVLFILLGLEPPSDFRENIKREAELDENMARRIADSINGSVFGKVMNEIKASWAPDSSSKQQVVSSKEEIGEDEMDYLNIAKAMRPIEDSGKQQVVSSKETKIPENLPIHDYKAGGDPYREPLG